jgi:glutamate synthase domain-containing protein 3
MNANASPQRTKAEVTVPTKSLPDGTVVVDAGGRDANGRPVDYHAVNAVLRGLMANGTKRIVMNGVMGQRYIAASATGDIRIEIHGTPGNDLGAFLDGPTIEVFGNAQDQTGNTMNAGTIIVHGNAWDVTGLAARGGKIMIQGDTGYRVGIHMKEYCGVKPTLVIGGKAKDYLGEYMAGGVIVVLGRGCEPGTSPVGLNIGAGIHGGAMYIRGDVAEHQLGAGATLERLASEDKERLVPVLDEYEAVFQEPAPREWERWVKVRPASIRPFSGHYDPTCV